jgi:hypothetical protein
VVDALLLKVGSNSYHLLDEKDDFLVGEGYLLHPSLNDLLREVALVELKVKIDVHVIGLNLESSITSQ